MDTNTLIAFQKRVERELLENILPFWLERSPDREHGGFIGRMSNDLRIDPESPKGLILNTRLLWTFSAVCQYNDDPRFLDMANRAYDYLERFFWDGEHSGAFWSLDRSGTPLDEKKKIYGQAFYIYALSEYYMASDWEEALDRAIELFHLIERHGHDMEYGGYNETCERDWSLAQDSRLSEKDMDEQKSMNNHLHVLEAYTNLFHIWPDETLAHRLKELIRLFQERILDPETGHFHHFFDERWQRKSNTYTFGHDIEGSWLLCEAADVLDDKPLIASVKQTALRLAQTALAEGIDTEYGGLFYEGRAGSVIDRGKEWWPLAEAVVGFLNAYRLSGDEAFFKAAQNCWTFIEYYIVDKIYGEWYWRVSEDGRPGDGQPKVSEWKGPYHNTRACLETIHRLRAIVHGE